MSSIRDRLLGSKPKTITVSVPEWGEVRIQEMTVSRKLAFYQAIEANLKAVREYQEDPQNKPYAEPTDEVILGVIYSLVDEDGNLVFNANDVPALKEQSYAALQAVYLKALEIGHIAGQIQTIESEKKD